MKEFSRIASAVQASTTLAIDSLYKKMKADGIDVIGFGAGEPDFDTPEHIKEAGVKAIMRNKTRYTPAAGIMELREAACLRLKEDCGLDYTPAQIVAASGAKHNIYVALRCLVNPGEEVVLPAPYWVSYKEVIQMVGGVPVIVEAREENGFKMTAEQLDAAITPNTKALILNNPSNPTGMMYTGDDLRKIAEVCVKRDIFVIADEIYYSLVYDGAKFTSFASLGDEVKERTVLVNGVSKSYAMSHSTGNPSSIAQWAAVDALAGPQSDIDDMRTAFEERRNYIVERMNAIPNVSCIKPEGAFYVMMNLEKIIGTTIHGVVIRSGDDFADLFLKEGLVAVVPCSGFGAPSFVRWSYATSMQNIKEGLDRLEKFLQG